VERTRPLGAASIVVAVCALVFLVIFGTWSAAGLSQTDSADPAKAIPFLRAHGWLYLPVAINSVVMHIAVLVLAVGLFRSLASRAPVLGASAAILGICWALMDIAQTLVYYNAVLAAPVADAATIDIVTKGLQNAAHLGGGLWTLGLVATTAGVFGSAHRAMGVIAGVPFTLHAFVVPLMPEWFYLEVIVLPIWFAWTGVSLLRGPLREPGLAASMA
jgi:hypothetical protein